MQEIRNNNNPEDYQMPEGKFRGSLLFVWDFLKVILIALIIILLIRAYVFKPFIVSGSSMEPNFHNNQYLIIDELTYRFHDPKRGDVLVLRYPKDPQEYFIKRVIGLPGEKVQVDNGHVTIYNNDYPNGKVLDEPYLSSQNMSYPRNQAIVGGNKLLTLGSDEYFMMGDNRLASSDSREWGVLPADEIIGKVRVRVLPLTDFRIYADVTYPQT